jgi:hypothetical protein
LLKDSTAVAAATQSLQTVPFGKILVGLAEMTSGSAAHFSAVWNQNR